MTSPALSMWSNWRHDFPAAIVVTLVALPLCLGIALASGASLFSGLIAGVVGGVVIGALSKSPLSVSGPAAGLTVIVLAAIQQLPTFEAFLLAVCIAGVLQIVLGFIKAGVIGDFIPSSVIKGMLAAIGIILILKQIPHAVGYDANSIGTFSFHQEDGHNTFSALWHMMSDSLSWGATIIASVSLAFLFWWDKQQAKLGAVGRLLPGPLIVVAFGVLANQAFLAFAPHLAVTAEHLVAVPITESVSDFLGHFTLPDFAHIDNKDVWTVAVTLALVASVETLLSIEAVDKLDPFKRTTPANRELMAQGLGNIASGMIGGLPVTSVIVRSSANVSSGGRTQMSTILHGVLLFLLVIAIPHFLNLIPLSALAAVLISVGFKLTKPAIFKEKYQKGVVYFVPFLLTIWAILMTDLLYGIGVGVLIGMIAIMFENFRSAVVVVNDKDNYLVRFKKDLFFIHKYEVKKALSALPDGVQVLLDLSRMNYMDMDNADIINDFIESAPHRRIHVSIKNDIDSKTTQFIKEPINVAV